MLFFDEFVKKIEKKEVNLTGRYAFGLEFQKKLTWLATGIPLLLMGVYQGYAGLEVGKSIYYIFALILIALSIYHFKMAFSYKIVIDLEKGTLKNDKLDLKLEEIKTATLKRMVAPGSKKLQACIDIITIDKKEIIVPLIMTKKVVFTAIIKNLLKEKFSIIKD